MSDVKFINATAEIEAEAARELAEERAKVAKGRIKSSLKAIADAERIVANLREQHAVLLRDIATS